MLRTALLLLGGFLGSLAFGTYAEAQTHRYELGLALQSSYYMGDIGRRGLIAPQSPALALELRRNINLRWALSGELGLRGLRGSARYAATSLPTGLTSASFSRTLVDLALGGEFHFFPYSDGERYLGTRPWTPFVGLGLGLAGGSSTERIQLFPSLQLRLGAKVRLSPRWALHASWTLRRTTSDGLEGRRLSEELRQPFAPDQRQGFKAGDSYGYWSLGLSYSLSPVVRYLCE